MGSPSANLWIDISTPLENGMVQWPGDHPFRLERMLDVRKGDPCTLSQMMLSVHTGTHIDAPIHFLPEGGTMDCFPLDATVGPARVIAIRNRKSITLDEVLEHSITAGERILFKTANSEESWSRSAFREEYVYIERDAGAYLAESAVRCVGIDYLSVDRYHGGGAETHKELLGAGVWIIEGLNLMGVEAGDYELVCLPLDLAGAEAAPARAIIRAIG